MSQSVTKFISPYFSTGYANVWKIIRPIGKKFWNLSRGESAILDALDHRAADQDHPIIHRQSTADKHNRLAPANSLGLPKYELAIVGWRHELVVATHRGHRLAATTVCTKTEGIVSKGHQHATMDGIMSITIMLLDPKCSARMLPLHIEEERTGIVFSLVPTPVLILRRDIVVFWFGIHRSSCQ